MRLAALIKYMFIFFIVLGLVTCKDDRKSIDVSDISVNVKLLRFDKEYFKTDSASFKDLKAKYFYLFPGEVSDSIWIDKKNDSITQLLHKEVQDIFSDFEEEHRAIENLFKHVKYYYANFKEPTLVTLISNLDMENQVIYADTLLLVSLDTYLGKEQVYYQHYPDYFRKNFDKTRIVNDIAMSIAYETIADVPYRVFLERMISAGKLKYAIQQFLPEKTQAEILNYTQSQLDWARKDEERIWKYFMEMEYLYSTDKELQSRFLDPAPFSKFYLTSDADSPGQIGVWLGYQIVQAYMKNNVVSLPEMMATPPIDIFNKSKYKPRK